MHVRPAQRGASAAPGRAAGRAPEPGCLAALQPGSPRSPARPYLLPVVSGQFGLGEQPHRRLGGRRRLEAQLPLGRRQHRDCHQQRGPRRPPRRAARHAASTAPAPRPAGGAQCCPTSRRQRQPRAVLRLPAAPRRVGSAPARPGAGRAAGFGRAASRRCHAEAGAVCVLQGGTARGARRRGGLSLAERRSRLVGRGGSGGAIPSLLVSGVPLSPSAAELQKGAAFRILRRKAARVRRCSCSGCVLRTLGAARGLLRRSCGCWPRGASPQGVVVQLGAARSVPAVSVRVGAESVRR